MFEYQKQAQWEVSLDGISMLIIVENILDNAIEDCMIQKKQPKICLKITQQEGGRVFIQISNTKEFRLRNFTFRHYFMAKYNRFLCDYRFKVISNILKAYRGKMQIIDEKQLFTVKIEKACDDWYCYL